MRSINEILNLVVDGKINTPEGAAALIEEEAADTAEALKIPTETARKNILANIGYATGYYSHDFAIKVFELFGTEHPIFGKTFPTPDEALRMGMERGRNSLLKDKAHEP